MHMRALLLRMVYIQVEPRRTVSDVREQSPAASGRVGNLYFPATTLLACLSDLLSSPTIRKISIRDNFICGRITVNVWRDSRFGFVHGRFLAHGERWVQAITRLRVARLLQRAPISRKTKQK